MTETNLHDAIQLFEDVLTTGSELINAELSNELYQHISKEQYDLLNLIHTKGSTTPGTLAVSQGVHKSAISNRLIKLINKGLVEWDEVNQEKDKRTKLIKVTEQGRAYLNEVNEKKINFFENLLLDLDKENVTTFITIMTSVQKKLETMQKADQNKTLLE